MFDKMKQLMEMQKQAQQIKKELDSTEIEVNEVNGITITINGSQNIKRVSIEESFLSTDNKSKVETDLLRSFNAAVAKSQKVAAQKMKEAMPGGFPGL